MTWTRGLLVAALALALVPLADAQLPDRTGAGIIPGEARDSVEVFYDLKRLMETDGGGNPPAELGTPPDGLLYLGLPDDANNYMIWGSWWVVPPDWDTSTDVSVSIFWFAQTQVDGDVRGTFYYYPFPEDGGGAIYTQASDSLVNLVTVNASSGSGGDINARFKPTRSWLGAIPAAELAVGDVMRFNCGRDPRQASDTYAGEMRMLGFAIRYVSRR